MLHRNFAFLKVLIVGTGNGNILYSLNSKIYKTGIYALCV